jgi:hypothetical protein
MARHITPASVATLLAATVESGEEPYIIEQPRLYWLAGLGLVAYRSSNQIWYIPNDAMFDAADDETTAGVEWIEVTPPAVTPPHPAPISSGPAIDFGIYASDEETFWQSWRDAGIVDENNNFLPEYSDGIQLSTSWGGQIDGVPGWHCNARVYGPLEAEFTYGLDQTDEHGQLLDIFERTWANMVFSLTEQPVDEATGFPAGWRNDTGVTYTDTQNFSSPSNVWA